MTTSEATAPSLPPEVAATQLLFQIGAGYMASAALQTVLKLGIADHMSAGPTSVADLARKTSVNEDALYRVMRTLASLGIFFMGYVGLGISIFPNDTGSKPSSVGAYNDSTVGGGVGGRRRCEDPERRMRRGRARDAQGARGPRLPAPAH